MSGRHHRWHEHSSQRRRLLRLAREAGEAYAHALRHAVRVEVRP
jgi:hypothetical protein